MVLTHYQYRNCPTRQDKGLFVFLLNQSASMEKPISNGIRRKADELTLAINAWLQAIAIACSRSEGINDYYDVSVLGYGSDGDGNPIIEHALIGPLAGQELVSISDVYTSPARIDTVTTFMQDEETGEMIEMPLRVPIWIDAKTQGGTPICSAIVKACELLDAWIPQHQQSFPPIVINITDGESSEGDPIPYAEALKQRATLNGNALFFNQCVSSVPGDSLLFPATETQMADPFARRLFRMSSILPDILVRDLAYLGQRVERSSRGMSFNADMSRLVLHFLDNSRAAHSW